MVSITNVAQAHCTVTVECAKKDFISGIYISVSLIIKRKKIEFLYDKVVLYSGSWFERSRVRLLITSGSCISYLGVSVPN